MKRVRCFRGLSDLIGANTEYSLGDILGVDFYDLGFYIKKNNLSVFFNSKPAYMLFGVTKNYKISRVKLEKQF